MNSVKFPADGYNNCRRPEWMRSELESSEHFYFRTVNKPDIISIAVHDESTYCCICQWFAREGTVFKRDIPDFIFRSESPNHKRHIFPSPTDIPDRYVFNATRSHINIMLPISNQ